jgi:uncharacterized protein (DUF952 family)
MAIMQGAGTGGPPRTGSPQSATDKHYPCWDAVFHLSPWSTWCDQRVSGWVIPEKFADEGFVHLTLGLDQLLVPANTYYRDDPRSYVALEVDLARVEAEVRFDAEPRLYPHLYGPLPVSAVISLRVAVRAADGTFRGWGERQPV